MDGGETSYDSLSPYLKNVYDRKGINELTLSDIKGFLNKIEMMKAEGRAVLKEKTEKRRALARYRTAAALDKVNAAAADPKARGAAKRLAAYLAADDPAKREKLLKAADRAASLQHWIYIDRMLELAGLTELRDMIAGGRDEANYQEGQHINRRFAGLDALLGADEKEKSGYITKAGTADIPIKGIWHNNGDYKYSKAFLMTASIGLDDPKMRKYILYGVLTSFEELGRMRDMAERAKGDKEAAENVKAAIKAFGDRKEKVLRAAIASALDEKDLAVRDYIKNDFAGNYDRIFEAVYQIDNTLMSKVDSYLPIHRRDGAAEISVNGVSFTYSAPENGFTIDRLNLPEYAVTPIETDIFKLYYRGVADQEHFAAFAPFVKEANAVLGGRDVRGRELKEKLRVMYGRGLIDMLEYHIAVLANPRAAYTGSGFGASLVGKAALGYITLNVLSGLKQVPQSFTPFLLEVGPGYLARGAGKYLRGIGLFNNTDYNLLVKENYAKSSDLARRVRDIEREYAEKLKAASAGRVEKGLSIEQVEQITEIPADKLLEELNKPDNSSGGQPRT